MTPRRLVSHEFWVRHRGVIGYLILVAAVFYLYHSLDATARDNRALAARAARVAVLGAQTHRAVCTLRGNLKHGVVDSKRFLASHPHGIPGIPAKAIQASITNQEKTISALAALKCP